MSELLIIIMIHITAQSNTLGARLRGEPPNFGDIRIQTWSAVLGVRIQTTKIYFQVRTDEHACTK